MKKRKYFFRSDLFVLPDSNLLQVGDLVLWLASHDERVLIDIESVFVERQARCEIVAVVGVIVLEELSVDWIVGDELSRIVVLCGRGRDEIANNLLRRIGADLICRK